MLEKLVISLFYQISEKDVNITKQISRKIKG